MICTNCGNTLADNAKFCPVCGNAVSAPNAEAKQQQVTMTAPVQQPVYATANPTANIQNKDKTIKIAGGIIIAVLAIAVIALFNTVSSQNDELAKYRNQVNDYESQMYQYEYQINQYENRNAIDKTIDAIDSWLR